MEKHEKGGKARAQKLTPERRAEIAKTAAEKRWGKQEGASEDVQEAPTSTPEKLTGDDMIRLFGEVLRPYPESNIQWGASAYWDTRPPSKGWQRVPGCCRVVKASIPKPIPYYGPKWSGELGVPTVDGRVFDQLTGHQMHDHAALPPAPRPAYGSRLKVLKGSR